jgi:hypothetical protein
VAAVADGTAEPGGAVAAGAALGTAGGIDEFSEGSAEANPTNLTRPITAINPRAAAVRIISPVAWKRRLRRAVWT